LTDSVVRSPYTPPTAAWHRGPIDRPRGALDWHRTYYRLTAWCDRLAPHPLSTDRVVRSTHTALPLGWPRGQLDSHRTHYRL